MAATTVSPGMEVEILPNSVRTRYNLFAPAVHEVITLLTQPHILSDGFMQSATKFIQTSAK